LPTVRLEADFKAVSKMGDQVLLALNVERLGSRSLTLQSICTGLSDGVVRMSMRQVLVFMSLENYQAMEIPEDIHAAISHNMAAGGHT
jgi:4-hydroxybenzoyl-CoA thioesterase